MWFQKEDGASQVEPSLHNDWCWREFYLSWIELLVQTQKWIPGYFSKLMTLSDISGDLKRETGATTAKSLWLDSDVTLFKVTTDVIRKSHSLLMKAVITWLKYSGISVCVWIKSCLTPGHTSFNPTRVKSMVWAELLKSTQRMHYAQRDKHCRYQSYVTHHNKRYLMLVRLILRYWAK